jgi:predicted deacylase
MDRKQRQFVLDVDEDDLHWLRARGLRPQFDTVLSAARRIDAKSIPGYACYASVEDTHAFIDQSVALYPQIASSIDIGDSWEKTQGLGGDDLRVLRITQGANAGRKPRLLIVSGVHAREYTPVEVNRRFAQWLLEGYGIDPEATWLVDHHEFHLLLQANPDGRRVAEFSGTRGQRKNRNSTWTSGCTYIRQGVDLNRNFPWRWNSIPNDGGSSSVPCDDDYRGTAAGSEPEVNALVAYADSLFPDTRGGDETSLSVAALEETAGLFFDLHSFSRLVLYPWGVTASPSPNDAAFRAMARRMAWFNGYTPEPASALYPTDGASDDHVYGRLGVPALTFEMGTTFWETCTNFDSTVLPANLSALRYAARIAQTPYQRGGGPDVYAVSATPAEVIEGEPFTVTATINDARFNQSNGVEATQAIASARVSWSEPPFHPLSVHQSLSPIDGVFDGTQEDVSGVVDTDTLAPGRHLFYVSGTDASGHEGAIAAGWIDVRAAMLKDSFE